MKSADLMRTSGVDSGAISRALSGERMLNPKSLEKVATAFGIPREEIFRAAGLLPPVTLKNKLIQRILTLLDDMTPDEIETAERVIRSLSKKNHKVIERAFDGG